MDDNEKALIAKRYLSQIKFIEQNINQRQQEIQMLYLAVSGVSAIRYDKDHIQTSAENHVENTLIRIEQIEDDIRRQVEVLAAFKHIIINQLQSMDINNQDMSNVLFERYINLNNRRFRSWYEISNSMGFTERHIRRLHKQALIIFFDSFLNNR